MIRLSAAVLAAILLFAAAGLGRRHDAHGAIRLAQADDQPMVITPQPRGEQLPPPEFRSGRSRRSL